MPVGVYTHPIGPNASHYKNGHPKCEECGIPLTGYRSKRCKKHKKQSLEARKNRSEICKKNGIGKWMLGKRMSEESKKKQREIMKKRNAEGGRVNQFGGYKGGYENRLQHMKKRRVLKFQNGGEHTLGEWQTLKAQYNFTCPCCGRREPEIKLSEDHIVPLSKGGSDNIENIQPLCKSCNSKKSSKLITYQPL